MEKPYLTLRFKFHDLLRWNNEDMKILSLGVFSFRTKTSLVQFLFKVWFILKKLIMLTS